LIEAALSLLEVSDYEQIQVKDIADKAHVSLGTLYNYFSSKERLFAEALVTWAGTFPDNIRRKPLADSSPGVRIKEALHRALRAFELRPQMARLVNVLVMSSDPTAGETISRLGQSTTDAYMQALSAVDPQVARRIVGVIDAVFSVTLREWSIGRITMREVHQRIDSAVDLLIP
jgi:AcrR family transcriptional regulator